MSSITYMCPEYYFTEITNFKSDIWAAGIVFYWLLLKKLPAYNGPLEDEDNYLPQVKDVTNYFGKINLERLK
jgi:hypothetical protein